VNETRQRHAVITEAGIVVLNVRHIHKSSLFKIYSQTEAIHKQSRSRGGGSKIYIYIDSKNSYKEQKRWLYVRYLWRCCIVGEVNG
jgi:hypothetical protein